MAKKTYYMQGYNGEVFTTQYPEYHKDCEQLPTQKGIDARREYCIQQLRKMIKPGQKIYCILRKVSGSGMSRNISLFIARDNEIRDITTLASDVLLWTNTGDGIRVGGCGMDMGFHTVYSLSRYLFRDGFGITGTTSEGRPYTPATKRQAENAVKRSVSFRGRNGDASGWDIDGGYALKHEWM